MNRIFELDSIRGLSAIAVLTYHYFFRYNEIYGHPSIATSWSYFGSYGVQLFFMVSGFVIYWSVGSIKRPFDFVVSRFSRLYPVYWCAVVFTFTLVYYFGLPGREVSFFHALVNLTMLQSYLKVPSVDGVYWTLAVEITFYFWVFLIYLSSNLKRIEIIFLAFVISSILNDIGFYSLPSFLTKILILDHISFFLAGICFFKIFNKKASMVTFIAILSCLLSIYIKFEAQVFVIMFSFYLFFYFAISGHLPFLKNRFLLFLGSISYPLYLVHQNLGYVVINKFYALGYSPLLGILCAALISVFLAFLLTKYIEMPSLTLIRNFYRSSLFIKKVSEHRFFNNKAMK